MPAARRNDEPVDINHLHSLACKRDVNQCVPLSRHYRSLDLLLTQVSLYRAANNEEQLYVMLLRFVSFVVETLKQHKDFNPNAAEYMLAQQRAAEFIAECEQLKASLMARNIHQPKAHTNHRPAEAIRIEDTSKLKDIDWDAAEAPAATAPPMPPGALQLSTDLEWPPRPSAPKNLGNASAMATATQPSASSVARHVFSEPVHYSSHYAPSSAQLREKHSLFVPRTGSGSSGWQQQQQQLSSSGRARYPSFDSSPIDAVWAAPPAVKQEDSSSGMPGLPDVSHLSLSAQQQQQMLHPSAGPSLGPQEVEVQNMLPCQGRPNGTCADPPPPPPLSALKTEQQLVPLSREGAAESAAAAAAGPKALSKRVDLRDVHISVALMNDFLHYAASNTKRGIESCGILAGRLSATDSRFTITTLIVPKQTGTSDTVEMLGEEEVWEVESSRELVPLGWIHTHPTQTCFLSSVDIHTQCGYQTMLEEAVAIVMAPTDSRKKCGIFRLTTPDGLTHVQRCTYRGFHSQCSSVHYELCGHVYLNPNAKHEVIDLR